MKINDKRAQNLLNRDMKKIKKGLCAVPFCRNSKSKKDPLCPRCRKQYDKVVDPVRYTYNALKNNAKRREKEFSISLEYFRQFCEDTGYMNGKGRRPDALSIDRIDSSKGYIPGNIQVLTLSQNGAKQNHDCPF